MKKFYLPILFAIVTTLLGVNVAQAQFTETFESFSNNQSSFTSNGQNFTTGLFTQTSFPGTGSGTSNVYLDNDTDTGMGKTYSIETSDNAVFTIKNIDIFLSVDSGLSVGGSGSIIIRGRLNGSPVFTVTRNTGIPDTFSPDNGFFNVNFATEGGADNSLTNIDEIQFEITGSFNYIAIDDFTFGPEEMVADTNPPVVQIIEVSGNPGTTADQVDFTVTFNEAASNVSLDDFSLDATGGATGNLSAISGSGTTYTVTVNNISGEGTISIDLDSGTDIMDALANTGTPAFTAGENHTVSACFEEDFESFSDGASTFTSNGLPFNSTNGLVVENVDDAGASGSDQYLDNAGNGPGTYAVQTSGGELFTVRSVDLYLSSIVAGTTPTNNGTLTINGKLSGADVFTITKTSGFPTDLSGDNGFFNVNFATDGASDYSTTNIDELEIVIGSSFVYLAVDHLDFCEAGTTDTFPPVVQSIAVSGNPTTLDTSVDFIVTFNENVTNVTADDFSLDLNGTTGNIASVTGANNIYTVTVNNIDGEGTISIDLNSSTNIQDAIGNSGPAAFSAGENHIVSDCFTEDFESFSDGATTFTSNGKAFTTTNGLEVEFFNGAGTDGSDQFLENNGAGAGSYSIQTTDQSFMNVNSLFLFVSSDGTGTVPSDDGTVAIRGMVDGSMVYTITLNSGNTTFPTTIGQGNNGFFEVDFATDGASDYSGINVDEIQIEILSDFTYLAVDRFRFCLDIDTTIPTVDIQGEPSVVNSTAAFGVTIQFSEDVSGFVIGDITVGNGSASNFVAVDSDTYTADITPSGAGDITIDIAANVAQDAAGNNNTAATQAVTIFDNTAPATSVTGAPAIVNTMAPYNVTIDFGEIVTGFVSGDIVVGNGSVTGFTDNGDGTFTVEITPDGNGNITIDIAANVAQDGAGNNNTAVTQAVTTFDNTAPAISITGAPAIVNTLAPYNVTIDFGEIVTGFVSGDIVVGNGSVTGFTDNGDGTFTVEITPDGNGNITIDIAANVAQDGAGNNNTAATQAVTTFDNTAPAISITGAPAIVNTLAPYNVTIDFGEIVTGFVSGDIVVGNGSVTGFTDNGDGTFTVEITPDGNGNITIDIGAAVAQDAAGNNNTASSTATTIYDASIPTVDIQGEPSIVNSTVAFGVTIQFSEDVSGFVIGDITVGNGSASNFVAVEGNTYTADITPSGTGDITIDVAANVAQDAAGNNNTAASTATTIYDATIPAADIQGEPSIVNSTAAFGVTIQFSEDVTGFVIGDITVGNGSASNFVAVDGNTYNVDITPSGTGDITIDIAANVAQDGAGNNNTAASQATTAFDNIAPTMSVTSTAVSPTVNDPIPVTITFNEVVTGFVISDITAGNGSLSNFSGSGTTYTVDVTPTANGIVTIDVNAGVAIDVAGNGNSAATQFSIMYNGVVQLAVQSVTLQGTPDMNVNTVVYTVAFNKNANNVSTDDFALTTTGTVSGSITSVSASSGTTLSVTITGIGGDGTMRLDLLESTNIEDDTAAGNVPAYTFGEVHTVDVVPPSVTVSSTESTPSNAIIIPVTITFDEAVTGFLIGDISAGNATLSNFSGSGTTYTVDVTPTMDGTVTIDVNSGAAIDIAGNSNNAAIQFGISYDSTSPALLITSSESSPTGANPIVVTVTFNEDVTGFTIADISVSNGTLSNFSGSGTTYTVDVIPITDGVVTVNVNAGVATDTAGNPNIAAMQFSIEFDGTLPVIPLAVQSILLQDVSNPNAESVNYEVTFNQNANNISPDDFEIVTTGSVSASISSISSNSGTTVIVTVGDITGQGTLKLDLLSATDITDNTATNIVPAFISGEVHTVDRSSPNVNISSTEPSYTYLNPISVTITFSEDVTGFTIDDIVAENAVLSNFSGSGDSYTVDVIPESDGTLTLNINTGAATDVAGNVNTPAAEFSIIYETAPAVGLVYPNPFRENLSIVSEIGLEILKVDIFDIKGNKVYSQLIDQQGIIKEIELPYLQGGLYFISLDYGDKKITKKIIKL